MEVYTDFDTNAPQMFKWGAFSAGGVYGRRLCKLKYKSPVLTVAFRIGD